MGRVPSVCSPSGLSFSLVGVLPPVGVFRPAFGLRLGHLFSKVNPPWWQCGKSMCQPKAMVLHAFLECLSYGLAGHPLGGWGDVAGGQG